MTRSVEDTVLMLESLTGYDSRDPHCLPGAIDWREALQASLRGWRVAYTPDFGVFPVDGQVAAAVKSALAAFEELGAHVEEVRVQLPRPASELGDLWCSLMAPNNLVQVERLKVRGIDLRGEHRADLPPELAGWLDRASHFTVMDIARDQELRTQVYDAIQPVFETYDLLLSPTLACPPPDNASDGNTLGPAAINGVAINRLIGYCLTFPFNFTGHPAASVPAGLIDDRWPVGLQIVGRKYRDADVITASARLEEARPWMQAYQRCQVRVV